MNVMAEAQRPLQAVVAVVSGHLPAFPPKFHHLVSNQDDET